MLGASVNLPGRMAGSARAEHVHHAGLQGSPLFLE
jgi:hypothetical protein